MSWVFVPYGPEQAYGASDLEPGVVFDSEQALAVAIGVLLDHGFEWSMGRLQRTAAHTGPPEPKGDKP